MKFRVKVKSILCAVSDAVDNYSHWFWEADANETIVLDARAVHYLKRRLPSSEWRMTNFLHSDCYL